MHSLHPENHDSQSYQRLPSDRVVMISRKAVVPCGKLLFKCVQYNWKPT